VNSVVAEARLTPNARFFRKNIVVLALKIANDFLETKESIDGSELSGKVVRERVRRVIVYVVTESRSIDDGESDPNAVFLKLYHRGLRFQTNFANTR
jgi:hypothetical protein